MLLLEPRPTRRIPIRMTPLIDVVFILLVFFMLTSRLQPLGRIELPTLGPGESSAEQQPPEVQLNAAGQLVFEGAPISTGQLIRQLQQRQISSLRLSANRQVTLDHFTRTLGILANARIEVHWARHGEDGPGRKPLSSQGRS